MRGSEQSPSERRTGPVTAILGAFLLSCQPAPAVPAFQGVGVQFAPLDSLLAYGRAATFVPELGDSQRLMLGSYPTGRHGPRVQIAPEIRSYAHNIEDFNQNHLLARIVNFDVIPYPKMNLAAFDTVYVWTDQLSPALPEGTVLLVSTLMGTRLGRRLTFHPGPGFRASQPAARFRWDDADEGTCIWCDWAYWCVIQ